MALYEPGHFNDRLLLGLKGTMSEAELHLIRARMRGGVLNKAKRGELRLPLPVGFVYDDDNACCWTRIGRCSRRCDTFLKRSSARARLPRRCGSFGAKACYFLATHAGGYGELLWKPLTHGTALHLFTIRVTLAPSITVQPNAGRTSLEKRVEKCCRWSNGPI